MQFSHLTTTFVIEKGWFRSLREGVKIAFKSVKVDRADSVCKAPQGRARTRTLVDGGRVTGQQTQLSKRKLCLKVRLAP